MKTTPKQWLAMSDEVKQAELNKRAKREVKGND